MKLPLHKSFLVLTLFLSVAGFAFAQSEREKGIELCRKGDFAGAIQILRQTVEQNENDGDAFYCLGLSLVQTQNIKEGAKALQKAAKLKPNDALPKIELAYAALLSGKLSDAEDKAEKAIALNPNEPRAYFILGLTQMRLGFYKSVKETANKAIGINPEIADFYLLKVSAAFAEAIVDTESLVKGVEIISVNRRTKLFNEAATILENYPNLSGNTENGLLIKKKIDNLKLFTKFFDELPTASSPIAPPDPSVTPLKILSKPRPIYTDAARQGGITGTVKMAVLFSASGTIDYVLPMSGLKFGLTQQAYKAAHSIKFEPQLKDGKPISVVKIVEYVFSLY